MTPAGVGVTEKLNVHFPVNRRRSGDMNETMKTLLTRRSIRKFKAGQVAEEELNAVREAGKFAPSGANAQSALFVVVQDREAKKKHSAMNAAVLKKEMDPYFGAPTIILVLADKTKPTPVEDASLALGNMMNAAAPSEK